ncbi:protein enabled homolog [Limulus polyphemus]|uniref:Protein enabled homolog n=1 Tax=Limulus polyphemus TaxID=6850 RepID=A0ABM1TKM9_LIMPO|nr:protein enabled homolog [Limulus polyphemus]
MSILLLCFAGVGNSGIFGGVDPSAKGHPIVISQDPWNGLHSFRPLQPGGNLTNNAPWGGLKAEAQRESVRIQWQERGLDQEQEKEKNRRVEVEKDRKEKEAIEKSKELERDREQRGFHHLHNIDRTRKRESHGRSNRGEPREVREASRSPVQISKHNIKPTNNFTTPKADVKIKEEKREDSLSPSSSSGATTSIVSEHQTVEITESQTSNNYLPQNVPHHPHFGAISKIEPNIGSASGSHLEQLPLPFTSSFKSTVSMTNSATVDTRDPYRLLDYSQVSGCGRDQIFQRYSSLHPVMPFLPYDPFHETEHARHLLNGLHVPDIASQVERGKLHPSILRQNDSSFLYASPGMLPFVPTGSLYPPPKSPFLSSITDSVTTVKNRNSSPGNPPSSIPPPPLIPLENDIVQNQHRSRDPSPVIHSTLTTSPSVLLENSRKDLYGREKCELRLQPKEADSQSR